MNSEVAVFGGGCFWCTEAVFQNLKGVQGVMPGYAGGHVADPTYEQVSSGESGHAEVTRVEFDPKEVDYNDLLEVFFATHDPTTLNRQGNDVGTQYRSVIFYETEEQKAKAEKFIENLEADKTFNQEIVTEIAPLDKFYEAEDYHKNYYRNNPNQGYCQVIISPKVAKLRAKFSKLLKKE